MTARQPPRFALELLEWFVPDGPAMAGDLLEQWERRRSRLWVWREVLTAIALVPFRPDDEIRPLRLVDLQPSDALIRSRRFQLRFAPVNLSASPIAGIGGLGIVVLGFLLTAVMPGAWWFLLASTTSGIGFGAALIAFRRQRPVR